MHRRSVQIGHAVHPDPGQNPRYYDMHMAHPFGVRDPFFWNLPYIDCAQLFTRKIGSLAPNSCYNLLGCQAMDITPFSGPIPPMDIWLYRSCYNETILDHNWRRPTFPHFRFFPEDEVAILDIPIGNTIDENREMRLDIDRTSYQVTHDAFGLPEDFVRQTLKTRTLARSPTYNFCVICQADYKHRDTIAELDCGHEYHGYCITKWLLVKNTCPVCKSIALTGKNLDL